jgi:hypothetical protein
MKFSQGAIKTLVKNDLLDHRINSVDSFHREREDEVDTGAPTIRKGEEVLRASSEWTVGAFGEEYPQK